jgi:hypothetical protein
VDIYYPFGELHVDLSQRLPDCTHDSIRARKKRFAKRLEDFTASRIFISIGENCGPGIKFRDAGLNLLGSQFFDNIVVNPDSVIKLLDADFADMFLLPDLLVDRWEGHQSVYNDRYEIFFHHYFYLQQIKFDEAGYRRIDSADIPLLLSIVQAQFEYLAFKFRSIVRSRVRTVLTMRRVDGAPVAPTVLADLRRALDRYGAVETAVIAVHSYGEGGGDNYCIPETDAERWGTVADWNNLSKRV